MHGCSAPCAGIHSLRELIKERAERLSYRQQQHTCGGGPPRSDRNAGVLWPAPSRACMRAGMLAYTTHLSCTIGEASCVGGHKAPVEESEMPLRHPTMLKQRGFLSTLMATAQATTALSITSVYPCSFQQGAAHTGPLSEALPLPSA